MQKDTAKQQKTIWAIAFTVSITLGVASIGRGTEYLGILLSISMIGIVMSILANIRDRTLATILLVALLVRLTVVIIHMYIFPLPDSNTDAIDFETKGWLQAQIYEGEQFQTALEGVYTYTKLIAVIYFFIGRIMIIPLLCNALIGVAIVAIIYVILNSLYQNPKAANIGGWIATFFPTLLLYSAITRRDILITFFVLVIVYFISHWMIGGKQKFYIASLIAAFFLIALHPGMIFMIGNLLLIFCMYDENKKKISLEWGRIFVSMVLVLIMYYLFWNSLGEKLPNTFTEIVKVEFWTNRLLGLPRGRTMYLMELLPESYFDLVWQTPVRIIYFLFSPKFWSIETKGDLLAGIDSILYMFMIFFLVKSWRKGKQEHKNISRVVLLTVVIHVIVFSWGVSNTGTAMRHRHKISAPLIILASMGISNAMQNIKRNEKNTIHFPFQG